MSENRRVREISTPGKVTCAGDRCSGGKNYVTSAFTTGPFGGNFLDNFWKSSEKCLMVSYCEKNFSKESWKTFKTQIREISRTF